jgi:hypothetical protein
MRQPAGYSQSKRERPWNRCRDPTAKRRITRHCSLTKDGVQAVLETLAAIEAELLFCTLTRKGL